jgi:hypothetical protein
VGRDHRFEDLVVVIPAQLKVIKQRRLEVSLLNIGEILKSFQVPYCRRRDTRSDVGYLRCA